MSADQHAASDGVSTPTRLGVVVRLALAERERWALWLPVALGAGAALYFLLRFEPSLWLGPTALVLALTISIALRRTPTGILAGLAVAAVALGLTAAQVRTALVAAPILQREIGPVRVVGKVDLVEVRPDDRRLTLSALTIDGLAADATPARVRVTMRSRGGDLAPNQQVALRAVLVPPSPPAAPGAFDFARDAFFDRIGGVGYVVSAVTVLETAPYRLGDGIAALRHRLSARIHAVLDGLMGPQVGSVAAALTTGERAGIDDETWNALRDSGLAHIISISGLHFALIAGILFFVTRAGLALIEPIAPSQLA